MHDVCGYTIQYFSVFTNTQMSKEILRVPLAPSPRAQPAARRTVAVDDAGCPNMCQVCCVSALVRYFMIYENELLYVAGEIL